MFDDSVDIFEKACKDLLPVIMGQLNPNNQIQLIQITAKFTDNMQVTDFLRHMSQMMSEHIAQPDERVLLTRLCSLIGDHAIANRLRNVISSIHDHPRGERTELVLQLALDTLHFETTTTTAIGLASILRQTNIETVPTLRMINALLPSQMQTEFTEIIDQWNPNESDEQNISRSITSGSNSEIRKALMISFYALKCLPKQPFRALMKLAELRPDLLQSFLRTVDRFDRQPDIRFSDIARLVLTLAAFLTASDSTAILLRTIDEVYRQMLNSHLIPAIRAAIPLRPTMENQLQQICRAFEQCFSRPVVLEHYVEVAFQVAMSIVDLNTAQSLKVGQESIELIRNKDWQMFARRLFDHGLVQPLSDNEKPMSTIVSRALELFYGLHDSVQILHRLTEMNELKPRLKSNIVLVHELCVKFQSIIDQQDQAKQNMIVPALQLLQSFASHVEAVPIAALVQLIQSTRSNSAELALESVMSLIGRFTTDQIELIVRKAQPILKAKLTGQDVLLETLVNLSNELLTDDKKQLLGKIRPLINTLTSSDSFTLEEALRDATALLRACAIDAASIALVQRAQEIRTLANNLRQSIDQLYCTTSLVDQARAMSSIAYCLRTLLPKLDPNLPTTTTTPFEMIERICHLLLAKTSLTLIFDSIIIVDAVMESFSTPTQPAAAAPPPVDMRATTSNETNRPTTVIETSAPPSAVEPTNDSEQEPSSAPVESRPNPVRSPRVFDESEMKSRTGAVTDIRERLGEIDIKSKHLKEQFDGLLIDGELGVCEMLAFLSDSTFLTRRIQELLDALQQMAVNDMREEIEELSRTDLPQVIVVSSELRLAMKSIEGWAGEICGHVKEKSRQIQAELSQVLEKLTSSRTARLPNKTTKWSELIEDYEIPADGQVCSTAKETLSNPADLRSKIEQIHQVIDGFEEARYGQGEMIRNTNFHHVGLHLEDLLSHPEIDSNALDEEVEESKEISNDELIGVPFADRDVILHIVDREKPTEHAESSMPITSLDHIYVRLSSDIETKESNKETNMQIKISKKNLQKLKKQSENLFDKLLKSVHKYDIGRISEACDPEQLPDVPLDRPRYTLLARITRNIQTLLLTRLRSALKKNLEKRNSVGEDLQFEFIFCVDNSNSMSGKKIREALNTLVILMETFHRLEWKFGVVRFGAEQKILKPLQHQSMSEQVHTGLSSDSALQQTMTTRGQYILESFTTDEKTLPATALKQIAENDNLFGRKALPNVKRFVIMITDGISPQTDAEQFNTELRKANADLYIVCIIPEQPKNSDEQAMSQHEKFAVRHEQQARQFSQRVAPDRNQVIEIGHLDMLTKAVVTDLINIIEKAMLKGSDINLSEAPTSTNMTVNQIRPLKPATISHWQEIQEWKRPVIIYAGRAFNSDPSRKSERVQRSTNIDLSRFSNEFLQNFNDLMTELVNSYSSTEQRSALMITTERHFRQWEQECDSYISEFARMMEDHLFAAYKPTQALPDSRGNRLHIPGVVKYLCTQGQYNRIYLNLIGSPRAEYRIALVLDQSVSMTGPAHFASVDVLFSMCAALNRIGIEDFNVLTFGKEIRLIKSYKQRYDRVFFHHLRTNLNTDGETTLLSDAIFAASQLLLQQANDGSNAGPMKIFVLTDGYTHRASLLEQVLSDAEQHSITVVGLGVGLECNGVCHSFQHWIVAQNPRLISDALIQWSNEQSDGQTPNDSLFHEKQSSTVQGKDDKIYQTTDDVWNDEMDNYFDELTMSAERTIDLAFTYKVDSRPLFVDICFVMDCTHSMTPWIAACKQHIQSIARGVQEEMQKFGEKTGVLRMAFVAYRDYEDTGRHDWIDFHGLEQIDLVEAKIMSQRAMGGGGDLCEDVQGGLDRALKLSWTNDADKNVARILVWVGDYPGHTPFCHKEGPAWDKHMNGLRDVPEMADLIRQIKDKEIFLLLSNFSPHVQFMLEQIEKIFVDDQKANQVKRIALDATDTSSLLREVKEQISTIIADEFM